MSATDIARELSLALIPARQSLKERLALPANDCDAAFAIVTLHAHAHAHAFTAVVCLTCFQTYVGVAPRWCACGALLAADADGHATNRLIESPSDASFIASLPTRYLAGNVADRAVGADEANRIMWPPWAIPPSIVGGATMATPENVVTSPYVSAVKIAPPPPPPPQAFLSHYQAATHQNDTWLVIALCLLLIGFVGVLRMVLAL